MLRAAAAGLALLAIGGCARQVPLERVERPVEVGVPARFTFDQPLRWEFSDGQPPVEGAAVSHVFTRSGSFEVKGYAGKALARHVAVLVEPRQALHVVPPTAQWALVGRTLDELSQALDLAERLAGPERSQKLLDEAPLLAFALDSAADAAAGLEPLEGAGVAGLEGGVFLSFVGARTEGAALETLVSWLGQRGFVAQRTAQGVELAQGGERWLAFVDRGTLLLARADGERALDDARRIIAEAPDLGLAAEPGTSAALDALPAGGVVAFARREALGSSLPWKTAVLALQVTQGHATLDGLVSAGGPLWTAPPLPEKRLLEVAPQGPVALLSASIPARRLAELVFGPRGSRRWKRFERDVGELGAAADVALEAVGPLAEAAVYLDVRRFVRSVVEHEGRPEPKGSLVVQLSHSNQAIVEHLVTEALARQRAPVQRAAEAGVAVFRSSVDGEPLELAVGSSALFVKAGTPLTRTAADLTRGASLPGAFGAGHVSFRLDVKQLRAELETPFTLDGIDPRRLLVAQALSVALVERLLRFDALEVDLAPHALGATLKVDIALGAKGQRPPPAAPTL